ncbi:TetR/AcrR family transcriptional regulator [Actinomadura harenae]|uniref:TetR/AcrR family transcriptional regulator n=1 Tax=Actinomadura harenae TaxID=2483351 RepID=A0A3M2LUH2_9ACTN|nr:TetR/AcrR family transcriptional regulator [Actinomadura harenae]
MSPRRADPELRLALIDIGARLLAEGGPRALSTRRLAAEAGCSTQAVYTHFGGMSGLVREMVHEGFDRLQTHFAHVADSDDPVADIALLGIAYRRNGGRNPHLYAIMFGTTTHTGYRLNEPDRQYGRYTLGRVSRTAARCIDSGRFTAADPELVAHHMWTAVHGIVSLELGDYLIPPYDADTCFETQLVNLMVAQGDGRARATRSIAAARLRAVGLEERAGGLEERAGGLPAPS